MALTDDDAGMLTRILDGKVEFPRSMPGIPVELTPEQQIALCARILDQAGFTLDVAGHITVVKPGSTDMWCTPYGLFWNEIKASDIISIDRDGQVIGGMWDVTPAVAIHTELHKRRPEARVIIHNHPYHATLLATMHRLPEIADQQACLFDGEMVLFDEYTGGVDNAREGQHLADALGTGTAAILANHGVLVLAGTIEQATYKATLFERTCRLAVDAARMSCEPVPVPPEARGTLKAMITRHSSKFFWDASVRNVLRTHPEVLQ